MSNRRSTKKDLADIAKNKTENHTIMACLERRNNRENNAGSTLPAEMQIFRFEFVESFLSSGIPLTKVDALRPLLEKHGRHASGHRLSQRYLRKKRKNSRQTPRCLANFSNFLWYCKIGRSAWYHYLLCARQL